MDKMDVKRILVSERCEKKNRRIEINKHTEESEKEQKEKRE
jgi:hypothetical protein